MFESPQTLRASVPTPFGPTGHFPLIGGIGPLSPRGAFVVADAHIGPLGSCEFAADYRKIGLFCRVNVGIDPYIGAGAPKAPL